jgi:elongation factor 1-alpha
MDATTPTYSMDRFLEIKRILQSSLHQVGYDPTNIPFVPISGFEGDNLVQPSTNLGWYNGPTLMTQYGSVGLANAKPR